MTKQAVLGRRSTSLAVRSLLPRSHTCGALSTPTWYNAPTAPVCSQPFNRHGQLLLELYRAGVPVFTEKPLPASVQVGERLMPESLIPPRTEQKEPRFLSTQEYEALLRACSHHPRDGALIEILLQTGLRLAEAARLTVQDVELPAGIGRDAKTTGRLRVVGEGARSIGFR